MYTKPGTGFGKRKSQVFPHTFTPTKEPAVCRGWKGAGDRPARTYVHLGVVGAEVTVGAMS